MGEGRSITNVAFACLMMSLLALLVSHPEMKFEGANMLWFALSVGAGVFVGRAKDAPVADTILLSLVPAAFYILALVLKYWIWRSVDSGLPFFIKGERLPPEWWGSASVRLLFGIFVASWLAISLAAIARDPIVESLSRISEAGPDGVERWTKIIKAIFALIAVVAGWKLFS